MKTRFLSAKQIAQTYILDDIIIHELILGGLNDIEHYAKQNQIVMTKFDIINRLCLNIQREELFKIFSLDSNNILRTIKNEYIPEINILAKSLESLFLIPET